MILGAARRAGADTPPPTVVETWLRLAAYFRWHLSESGEDMALKEAVRLAEEDEYYRARRVARERRGDTIS